MDFFFSKHFDLPNLGEVNYHKCGNCGFTASATHYDLSEPEWKELNYNFHSNNNLKENPYNRHQRYFNQTLMINIAKRYGLFKGEKIIDWASGQGLLSKLAKNLYDIDINNFDKFITPEINALKEEQVKKGAFDLVLNCALFEHVTTRDTLNEIESLVSEDGCFAIHTLVREEIPEDPDWMYLLSVHCSFFTNRSMQLLMDQWEYACSVYNEDAKMWMFFKQDPEEVKQKTDAINKLLGWNYLKFKKGFMDYWK